MDSKRFLSDIRLPALTALTLALTAFGLFVALGLRFEFSWDYMTRPDYLLLPLPFLLCARYAGYLYWGINERSWRHTSTPEIELIVRAHFASSIAFAASVYIFRFTGLPRSIVLLEFVLSLTFMAGVRYLARKTCSITFPNGHEKNGARAVVVIGAGDSGHLIVRNLLAERRFGYEPVAVLDDSERLIGTSVHGVEVKGPVSSLRSLLLANKNISAVILAIPSVSRSRYNEIRDICEQCSVPLKRVQAFEDIACLDAASPVRRLDIESLLHKSTDVTYENEIRERLSGKRVMVTGAGGSIGSELVRQILAFGPSRLVMFDSSEYSLFEIDREIRGSNPEAPLVTTLGNICDSRRLKRVLKEERPEIIFHTAAYKHVPLLEANAYSAFRNNVVGTRNLLLTAPIYGARHFVLISSDKAVDPASVMGASKRVCEMLVEELCSKGSKMSASVVRFGNVINSAGSVIPTFKRQIEEGGPVTVTHPDMERYFMSISEAVRLVLTAGILGETGEIYVLDMGRKIKIVDVARKMLALYARRDIPIVFTGLRPGEKLTEELLCQNEQRAPTQFERVKVVRSVRSRSESVFDWAAFLEEDIETMRDDEIAAALLSFAQRSQHAALLKETA